MTASQQVVSLKEFAAAMLESDRGFADRVRQFEERFGTIDEDTLGVLAQAAYFCWTNHQLELNMFELCRALSTGEPTSLFYHCQITAERWIEMHAYVVGVQRWIGITLEVPEEINTEKANEVVAWLREPNTTRVALARLFLTQLIDDLLNYVSLAKLCNRPGTKEEMYPDFTKWYFMEDGRCYATPHNLASADGRRFTWNNKSMAGFVEELKQIVRNEMSSATQDQEELIASILKESQPPCMHRFSRYQDIKIASIGALKWRGNLPPDDFPKANWQAFMNKAKVGLQSWVNGASPAGELAVRVQEALGKPTERGKAIVRDFLLADRRGEGVSWNWLVHKSQEDGITAGAIFKGL